MVPFWLFLTAVIPLTLIVVVLFYVHFIRNPLPFPDWGNAGFILPDKRSRQAVVTVLRTFGLSPDFRVDTIFVSRAIYRSKFPFILDLPSEDAAGTVGNPDSFIAVVVKNPSCAAYKAANHLRTLGFEESKPIDDPDPELKKGKLSVVVSDAFPGKMLVFRRHILKMGGPSLPPRWTDDECH